MSLIYRLAAHLPITRIHRNCHEYSNFIFKNIPMRFSRCEFSVVVSLSIDNIDDGNLLQECEWVKEIESKRHSLTTASRRTNKSIMEYITYRKFVRAFTGIIRLIIWTINTHQHHHHHHHHVTADSTAKHFVRHKLFSFCLLMCLAQSPYKFSAYKFDENCIFCHLGA